MRSVEKAGGAARSAPSDAEPLSDRIAALADLPIADLKVAWTSAWGTPPPKGARRRLMMLGIAWRWQAEVHGGFRPEIARRLAALEKASRGHDGVTTSDVSGAARPRPGSRILRVWRGTQHEVHVTGAGYLWRGKSFGSLSSVAKAITGVNRNGPAFFGLRPNGSVN
ncbi:MAG: DUF2924 domain-containing protein [Chloroflexota bacterium]|nr:DUF2924 domain-containing protein [Chloroflexota bacterium]